MNQKYVVIPGRGVDLFALKKFGIRKGPIKTPLLLPIEVVGELVNQYNRPEIFEVVVTSIKKYPTESKAFSDPVLLTPENYTKSYYEITGTEKTTIAVDVTPAVVVKEEVVIEEDFLAGTTELQPETVVVEETIIEDPVVEDNADPIVEETSEELLEETTDGVDDSADELSEEDEEGEDPILNMTPPAPLVNKKANKKKR